MVFWVKVKVVVLVVCGECDVVVGCCCGGLVCVVNDLIELFNVMC